MGARENQSNRLRIAHLNKPPQVGKEDPRQGESLHSNLILSGKRLAGHTTRGSQEEAGTCQRTVGPMFSGCGLLLTVGSFLLTLYETILTTTSHTCKKDAPKICHTMGDTAFLLTVGPELEASCLQWSFFTYNWQIWLFWLAIGAFSLTFLAFLLTMAKCA